MDAEKLEEIRRGQQLKMRLNWRFARAWREIAVDRGYRYDAFLSTASHGTIAYREYLSSKGV